MKLPTEPTPAKRQLQGASILIYGAPKTGKTTMAASTPHPVFIATEPGLSGHNAFQLSPKTWDDFTDTVERLEKEDHGFDTVVIDTIDGLYRLAADYVCKMKKIRHESELDYGKATGPIRAELYRWITRMARMPTTLLLTSHAHDKEFKSRTGKFNRIVPTVPESFRQTLLGFVDIILYCEVDKLGERIVHSKPNLRYDAGDRFDRLHDPMPLDYSLIEEAFNNQQDNMPAKGETK